MAFPFQPRHPEDEQEPLEPLAEEPIVKPTGPSPTDKPAVEQPASPETALPPEVQWETNGGPLGCCLGVMVGLVLSLTIAVLSRLFGDPLYDIFQNHLSLLVRLLMGVAAIGLAILCGYFGWKIGKRLYREYDPPIVKNRNPAKR